MTKIILDTSFMISCAREKIDFFEQLISENYKIIIPKQVVNELKRISDPKINKKLKFRDSALIVLKLIEAHEEKIEFPDLKAKTVDKAIIKYSKANPKAIVATLDREIKHLTENKKMVIKKKKKLEII